MYYELIVEGIQIVVPYYDHEEYYVIINKLSEAKFIINRAIKFEDEVLVMYTDSFGNLMSNNKKLKVVLNKDQEIQFKNYREQVTLKSGKTVSILPMKDIQEIANQTFYVDKQKHVVNFLNFTIIQGDNAECLFNLIGKRNEKN
ncbi:hypothetical protein [Flavobacterium sp.]|uniref:hypothetical protein n=1 Tax=Flavobacterium sp. TaxID=239 RepID=UPI003D0E1188